MDEKQRQQSRVWGFFSDLGPGLITGAADDDPSGIATYSVTGAALGYKALWIPWLSLPLMIAVQLMCARLGMVTGRGLAGVVRRRYSRAVLWGTCLLLVIANTMNIGADLGGMAAATELVTGVRAFWSISLYGGIIVSLLFWRSYKQIVMLFKWFTLALFAYVGAAFLAHPDWAAVAKFTMLPHVEFTKDYLAVLVAILGTTISPYLFFWQAAQEVEEERAMGRRSVGQRMGATDEELRKAKNDVMVGMAFSMLIMYFITATTGATLHQHGITHIETARQAAEALRPLAGDGAYWLFSLGLIGTGMLGVPVLAGSTAYAVSEAAAWGGSLEQKPHLAPKFYAVVGFAVVLGICLDLFGWNPVRMLFWSAVLNGVLASPLIALVVILTSDPKVMGRHTNSPALRYLGWTCSAAMGAAALALFLA